MFTDVTHREPVSRFATTTRRRVFMLLASIGFVLVSAGSIVAGVLILMHNITEFTAWVVAVLVVYGGIMGLKFFGPTSVGAWKNNMGANGAISLILSPAGLTDRTQIVGPLPMIPWSIVSQYEVNHERASLILRFHDVDDYERLIEPYRFFGWHLTVDPEDTSRLVHTVDLEHIQASEEELMQALHYLTDAYPGQPLG
jgi:hypothetical protein